MPRLAFGDDEADAPIAPAIVQLVHARVAITAGDYGLPEFFEQYQERREAEGAAAILILSDDRNQKLYQFFQLCRNRSKHVADGGWTMAIQEQLRLIGLPLTENDEKFERLREEFIAYRKNNNGEHPTPGTRGRRTNLQKFVHKLRSERTRRDNANEAYGPFHKLQIVLMDQVGFDWGPRQADVSANAFDNFLGLFKVYYKIYGTSRINHKINFSLYWTARHMRGKYLVAMAPLPVPGLFYNPLTPTQIQRAKDHHFDFELQHTLIMLYLTVPRFWDLVVEANPNMKPGMCQAFIRQNDTFVPEDHLQVKHPFHSVTNPYNPAGNPIYKICLLVAALLIAWEKNKIAGENGVRQERQRLRIDRHVIHSIIRSLEEVGPNGLVSYSEMDEQSGVQFSSPLLYHAYEQYHQMGDIALEPTKARMDHKLIHGLWSLIACRYSEEERMRRIRRRTMRRFIFLLPQNNLDGMCLTSRQAISSDRLSPEQNHLLNNSVSQVRREKRDYEYDHMIPISMHGLLVFGEGSQDPLASHYAVVSVFNGVFVDWAFNAAKDNKMIYHAWYDEPNRTWHFWSRNKATGEYDGYYTVFELMAMWGIALLKPDDQDTIIWQCWSSDGSLDHLMTATSEQQAKANKAKIDTLVNADQTAYKNSYIAWFHDLPETKKLNLQRETRKGTEYDVPMEDSVTTTSRYRGGGDPDDEDDGDDNDNDDE